MISLLTCVIGMVVQTEKYLAAHFDKTGKPRDAGTLKNGNGTRVLYTEEGEVREIVTYDKGMAQQ